MLNYFPTSASLDNGYSPRTLMTGEILNYKTHLSLKFGDYCQVHEQDEPRNSQLPRTQGAICLGPTRNLQAGFHFLNLRTGLPIKRYSWDKLPMPDAVIARVNRLGAGQPKQLIFLDRKGRPIGDLEFPGVDSDPTDPGALAGVDDNDSNEVIDANDDDLTANDAVVDADTSQADEYEIIDPENIDLEMQEGVPGVDEPVEIPGVDAEIPGVDVLQDDPAAGPVEIPGVPDDTPGLRRSSRVKIQAKAAYIPSMTGSKYSVALTQLEDHGILHPDFHEMYYWHAVGDQPDVVAAIMTQLSMKAGMKRWGKEARDAVHSEMKQLHFRDTFQPVHYRDLDEQERKMLLESHMFLKQKRDGKIKARTVAGGNKQRDFISKEDSSSPTVATEAVLLTCIIDAEEGRDVAVIDIPNAFIQTRVKEKKDMALIKIRGLLVDVLLEIAPDVYGPYATANRKGEKELIVRCLNAIYGTMVASLLYYNKFLSSLKRNGFVVNPYDPCTANRIVDGKQQTIVWHVDDCKLSHVDPKVNDAFIEVLREEYESIFEDGSGKMTISRGKKHTYLGMLLDYTVPGEVSISMLGFIQEILDMYDKEATKCTSTKTSAAPVDLFRVRPDSPKLSPAQKDKFHSLVAKTLFATKRARPDTGTSISFLTTRVREPDEDDWAKLAHLMKYLRGTKEMPLKLSANGSGILKWWVDGSFAVHPNMRGHTGGGLSMGRGFPIATSSKQKLNTRSSTESELVAVDDCMPAIMWTRYFLEAQGYGVKENIVYQDNISAILLEKNGKSSSSKRTKHISVRYYFVTDRIKKGDISIEWCPTEDMTSDFGTKPNQGATFTRFRDQLMGVVEARGPGSRKPKGAEQAEWIKVGPSKKPKDESKRSSLDIPSKRKGSPQECVRVRDKVSKTVSSKR
jgi:hypothetical protein